MLRHAVACCGMLPNPYVQLQKTGAAACCGCTCLGVGGAWVAILVLPLPCSTTAVRAPAPGISFSNSVAGRVRTQACKPGCQRALTTGQPVVRQEPNGGAGAALPEWGFGVILPSIPADG